MFRCGFEKKKGKKLVLKQLKLNILTFIKTVLFSCQMEKKFAEHLRKAWNQWQIKKHPIIVNSSNSKDVAIRTREDYLCMSETVSTHWSN